MLCSKIFQKMRFLTDNPVLEVTLLYLFGILSYVLAEIASMSGVITVLVCGLMLAHFNFYNLSMTGQLSTGYFLYHTLELPSNRFLSLLRLLSSFTWAYPPCTTSLSTNSPIPLFSWNWPFVFLRGSLPCMD